MTSQDFTEWDSALGIRRSTVLFVTLWMTWRAFEWAAGFASHVAPGDGLAVSALIAAVTAPVTYLQAAVFKAYLDSKSN